MAARTAQILDGDVAFATAADDVPLAQAQGDPASGSSDQMRHGDFASHRNNRARALAVVLAALALVLAVAVDDEHEPRQDAKRQDRRIASSAPRQRRADSCHAAGHAEHQADNQAAVGAGAAIVLRHLPNKILPESSEALGCSPQMIDALTKLLSIAWAIGGVVFFFSTGEEILPAGTHTVEVAVLDEQGSGELYLRDLEFKTNDWFYVGMADLTLSDGKTSGPIDLLHVLEKTGPVYVGGSIIGLEKPEHHSFKELRHTPAELRQLFAKNGWNKVVAFQTRNPLHKAHYELTVRAAKEAEAHFLLHPIVGLTKPGDVDYYTRVRCYQAILKHYPEKTTMISLLPLAMRMAGPREALWHSIIRKNYGCTHFIVGRDHAGPGKNAKGEPFYGPYDAQTLVAENEKDLGITMVPFKEMVYVEDKAQYLPITEVPQGTKVLNISGTEFRKRLHEGTDIPEWFSFPEVIQELRKEYPEKTKQGFTLFFTGLSGSGKSTIANAVLSKLMERGDRPVTLLDGDIVRKNLSSELGFSKEHRDLNIQRIGFVASEITKNRGIAICAPIAPYDKTRKHVREVISQYGGFILVHVATPLEICEQRDRKGLYAKARQGIIKEFTGISDPYEEPKDAEIVIDTSNLSPDKTAQHILTYLEKEGYLHNAALK